MAVKDDNTLITKGDLKKFYNKILPYMGGNYVFNTLGTKDYYSEDEKVIGVWTDGKPVYRKVYKYVSTMILNKDTWTNSNIKLDNVDIIISSKVFGGSYGVYSNIQSSINGTVGIPSGTLAIYSITVLHFDYLIIEYTKTTDTANSAVDTVGCYDITRPDLWPENKEITFGNGLYGQRFTGTYSLSAKQWKSINLSTLIPSSIIDYGGTIQQSTGFNTLPLCFIGTNGALQSEATIWYDPSNNTGLTVSIYINTAQSNSKYDIWVTYKKK